jgi:hypothetical protein
LWFLISCFYFLLFVFQLKAPLSPQFINVTQLNELVAIKQEYTRIYTAAIAKYKQKQQAALSAPLAVQELCTSVEQACEGIHLALHPGDQQGGQSSLPPCQCLNFKHLQGSWVAYISHWVTYRVMYSTAWSSTARSLLTLCFLFCTENLTTLSDYLTPFFISKKKKCKSTSYLRCLPVFSEGFSFCLAVLYTLCCAILCSDVLCCAAVA